jgi:hypothetical protein
MGTVQDVKNNGPAIQKEDSDAMQLLGDGIGVVANVLQVAGLGGVAQLIDKLRGVVDPVQASLTALGQKMDAALHFEAAHDEDEHMFHVNDVISDAQTNWRTLFEVNFDFSSQLVNISLFEQNTSKAANELANKDIYWVRPFYSELAYRDGWFTGVDPPIDRIGDTLIQSLGPTLPQVFDYRLTMPAFLTAIQIRTGFIAALRTARPDVETDAIYQAFLSTELVPMVNRLSSTYSVIVSGLVTPPVPQMMPQDKNDDFQRWGRAGSPSGAVDIYAGFGIVNQTGTRFLDPGLDYQVFAVGYQVQNLLMKKKYYADSGLGGIWTSIQKLKPVLGQKSDAIDVNASISMREISGILGNILVDDPSGTLQVINLAGIAIRLTQVGMLGNLQPVTPVPRPVSMRAAIAAAVSQLTLLPQPVPQL